MLGNGCDYLYEHVYLLKWYDRQTDIEEGKVKKKLTINIIPQTVRGGVTKRIGVLQNANCNADERVISGDDRSTSARNSVSAQTARLVYYRLPLP